MYSSITTQLTSLTMFNQSFFVSLTLLICNTHTVDYHVSYVDTLPRNVDFYSGDPDFARSFELF